MRRQKFWEGYMTPERHRRRRLMSFALMAATCLGLLAVAAASGQVSANGGATHGKTPTSKHHAAASASALALQVVAPSHVNQTVLGCRNNGSITLPNGSGQFICPDAAYTGGDLGKGWNELDLVPFRLITDAGTSAPASQTYDTGVAFDSFDAGHLGYDVISALTLNASESDASCALNSQSPQTDIVPGFGGIAKSIGRTVNITQAENSHCVFDYYGRLARGSHLFPCSSLHGNLSHVALSGT